MKLMVEHSAQVKKRGTPKPKGMSIKKVPEDVRKVMEETALNVFTDMVNSGASLQQTLAAIYLSGIENAMAIWREHESQRTQ